MAETSRALSTVKCYGGYGAEQDEKCVKIFFTTSNFHKLQHVARSIYIMAVWLSDDVTSVTRLMLCFFSTETCPATILVKLFPSFHSEDSMAEIEEVNEKLGIHIEDLPNMKKS